MSEESVNIKKRILELVDMIKKYDEAYFNNSISLISDYEYDCLVEELEQLEKKYPESNISLYRKKLTNAAATFGRIIFFVFFFFNHRNLFFFSLFSFFVNLINLFSFSHTNLNRIVFVKVNSGFE